MTLAHLHYYLVARPHLFGTGTLLVMVVLASIAVIAFWPGNSQQK
jgi:hypothetical protein